MKMVKLIRETILATILISIGIVSFPAAGDAQQKAEVLSAKDVTRLVLLGTAAGRTSYRGSSHGGFSAAVAVGRDVYLVDFGRNWLDRYFEAGLGSPGKPETPGGLDSLRAAFITHLHADHVVDLPRLILFGASDGARNRKSPIQIMGPGSRGELPVPDAKVDKSAEIINPAEPTPGTVSMVEHLYRAFATDLNDNILDSGMPNPRTYLQPRDIRIPAEIGASPQNTAPKMPPFEVYRDEKIRVTATLVEHGAVYPAFAYRFDTPNGSIVFSGDTNLSDNLITLARGADILVHEVIDVRWAEARYPEPRTPDQAAKFKHLIESHTDLRDIGRIAAQANVKSVVLAHLAPPTINEKDVSEFVKGFDGSVILGKPLMTWTLGD
ncbi:Metal-dependent hydrolase, beta-lactamase superfamily III precursor [Bosea sp. LC85]|uniref:MBL fold metallo-hydrolase n=1 Tax=Bosea sp. LC85 TaxID=1502851 RepID=UPI0004E2DCF9|nr:MBL fold metallo-hydrolase [Bosea sp. LC85]KFC64820.1 Metal-dependent hydrolase, beta-lactamase superfamily III precursor [Bosea sp. LC85]